MTIPTEIQSVLSGSPLSEKQADLVDQVNVYLLGRHEEIAEEGGVWEEKDTIAVLDLMLQALGSSWHEYQETFNA